MNFEDRFHAEWISAGEAVFNVNKENQLNILQEELANIENSLTVIEEKQRRLANLSKLYN